jgi:PadR family transcriptional regulator, regulatory protein PadR
LGDVFDNEQISAYSFVVPRRRPGTLLPIEQSILAAGLAAGRSGRPEFHGFALASAIQEHEAARRLTAHGTLYRALARMEEAGLLTSRWEDAEVAVTEGRPRRRLYRVTGLGEAALAEADRSHAVRQNPRPGLASP